MPMARSRRTKATAAERPLDDEERRSLPRAEPSIGVARERWRGVAATARSSADDVTQFLSPHKQDEIIGRHTGLHRQLERGRAFPTMFARTASPSRRIGNVSTGGRSVAATQRPSRRLKRNRCQGQVISARVALTWPSANGPIQCGQTAPTANTSAPIRTTAMLRFFTRTSFGFASSSSERRHRRSAMATKRYRAQALPASGTDRPGDGHGRSASRYDAQTRR